MYPSIKYIKCERYTPIFLVFFGFYEFSEKKINVKILNLRAHFVNWFSQYDCINVSVTANKNEWSKIKKILEICVKYYIDRRQSRQFPLSFFNDWNLRLIDNANWC